MTVNSTAPDKVKASLVNIMLSSNFRISKDTPYELAFDGPVTNPVASVLLGSEYDSVPVERMSFMMAEIGGNTRVVADIAIITNPGSAFERRTPVNNSVDSAMVQEVLNQLRSDMDPSSPGAQAKAKGNFLGVHTLELNVARAAGAQFSAKSGVYITMVDPGSVAERAGVLKGDVIISLGTLSVNSDPDLAAALNALPSGATAPLVLVRGGSTMSLTAQFAKPKA